MKHQLTNGATTTVWILYSRCATGTYIEGVFTDKVQAEANMRWHKTADLNNSNHWLREVETQQHGHLPIWMPKPIPEEPA